MEELEERVSQLERAVGTSGLKGETLRDAVATLVRELQAALVGPSRQVVEECTRRRELLEMMGSEAAGLDEKAGLEVLRAALPRMERGGELLTAVEAHERFVNDEALGKAIEMSSQVAELRAAHELQREAIARWDGELEALLEHYQDNVRRVSVQLLKCDAIVHAIEAEKRRE